VQSIIFSCNFFYLKTKKKARSIRYGTENKLSRFYLFFSIFVLESDHKNINRGLMAPIKSSFLPINCASRQNLELNPVEPSVNQQSNSHYNQTADSSHRSC
jgi:hypothetical protein